MTWGMDGTAPMSVWFAAGAGKQGSKGSSRTVEKRNTAGQSQSQSQSPVLLPRFLSFPRYPYGYRTKSATLSFIFKVRTEHRMQSTAYGRRLPSISWLERSFFWQHRQYPSHNNNDQDSTFKLPSAHRSTITTTTSIPAWCATKRTTPQSTHTSQPGGCTAAAHGLCLEPQTPRYHCQTPQPALSGSM